MGKLGQAPAMVPRQSGAQGTIVQQSVALQIRGEVLKSKEVVYKVTCSNVDDMDEVWKDLSGWIGWKERVLGIPTGHRRTTTV